MASTIPTTLPGCTAYTRPPMASYGTVTARSDSCSTTGTLADSSSDEDSLASPISAKTPLLPARASKTKHRKFVTVAGLRRRAAPALRRLNPAMELVNSGSVARDHLASERTFLAYVRTSLGICSMGIGAFPASPGRVTPPCTALTGASFI
jgi:hypothetical protein